MESSAAALPSGIVTFLFTDIEGSTRRWDRDRAAMEDAVRRHDRILRGAAAAHGGAVFKTIGDAFCVAFGAADRAAAAALDAQRALQTADFLSVGGLQVRMALNTGTADERDGDYFGPALNRVARLLAIGNGGQILLSQTSADLVHESVPRSASLVDLGTHRLKDLARPERVFQLVANDVHADARPLRSRRAATTNLPAPASSFIGRGDDVVRVAGLLDVHRLVTVTGPGGIGKTRLALQAARWVADAWDDGVWLVELAPLVDGTLVAAEIAKEVTGTQLAAGGDTNAALAAAIGQKQLLIVLDNCEHVLEAAGDAAATLLRGCPNVAILASSRSPLAVSGEVVLRASGLDERDAIALFAARAHEADADFSMLAETADVVAAICRRLDGIPLAIELAAARVRLLGARGLRDRLEHRLRTLVGGARDLSKRQRTLRATIDWSYDLLDADAQRLFRSLGAFAGGFTPAAVAAVAGAPYRSEEDAFEALCALESGSLVLVDYDGDDTRFRLLASLREYALERLTECGEREAAAARHLAYFGELAARAEEDFNRSASDTAFATALAADVDNVRAALAWSLESGDVASGAELLTAIARPWSRLGLGAEGIDRVERFIARMPAGNERLLARLWTEVAYLAGNTMRTTQAMAAASEAVQYARAAGDPATLGWTLTCRALVAARQRDFDAADAALAEARALGGEDMHAGQRLTELEIGAFVAQLRGHYDEAAAAYEEQLALLSAAGDDYGAVNRVMSLAETEHARGNTARAADLARGMLPAAAHAGDEHHAGLLSNLAAYLLALDDVAGARSAAVEAIELLAERDAASPWVAAALEHLALAMALDGDYDRASRLAAYCDAAFLRLGFQREAAETSTHERLFQLLSERYGAEWETMRAAGATLQPADVVAEGLAVTRSS